MGSRSIEAILRDWRDAELRLETATDPVAWAMVMAKIRALKAEHQAAIAARADEARELRRFRP